jgi:hypothetical protein
VLSQGRVTSVVNLETLARGGDARIRPPARQRRRVVQWRARRLWRRPARNPHPHHHHAEASDAQPTAEPAPAAECPAAEPAAAGYTNENVQRVAKRMRGQQRPAKG